MSALQVQYGSQIELSRTTRTIEVGPAPVNSWGAWEPSSGGPDASKGKAAQFLSADDKGWHGTTLVQGEKGWLRPIRADGTRVDAPWWTGKEWRQGYARYAQSVVGSHPSGEVWPPEDAVRIMADRCTLTVRCIGSPSRCVRVIGNGNDLTVHCVQGEPSNAIQDLAAVRVDGDGNTLRGFADGKLCAVFVQGNDNRLLDLAVTAGEYGSDVGAVYLKGHGYIGTRLTNVTVAAKARSWPSEHLWAGVYADDRHSGVVTWNVLVSGFQYGFYSNGGSDHDVRRFTSVQKNSHRFW